MTSRSLPYLHALDRLEAVMVEAYKLYAAYKAEQDHDPRNLREFARRQEAIECIDDTLDYRPLTNFAATHLEFLVQLYCSWRDLEHDAGAPSPQPPLPANERPH
jgi:hypothetical protein